MDISTTTFFGIFITSITATGAAQIIGIDLMYLGGFLAALIPFVVEGIKKFWPALQKRAWLPAVIGVIGFMCAGLATGSLTGWIPVIKYIFGGIASGSISSWGYNLFKGK